MVDNLEEALSEAGLSNLVSTVLHPLLITGEEISKVDDRGCLVGRHADGLSWILMKNRKSLKR